MVERFEPPVSLQPLLTLATPSYCRALVTLRHPEAVADAVAALERLNVPWHVLGGGSNLVVASHYEGAFLRMATRGVRISTSGQGEAVSVAVEAGEPWPQLVRSLSAQGLGGLENLALIPGTAGAAPVQNIGAYGRELAQVLDRVEVWDVRRRKPISLTVQECELGYRNSVFKSHQGRQWVILRIWLKLLKPGRWEPDLHYGDLDARHHELGHPDTPEGIVRTIEHIRREKLPDPDSIPNAGSFFKNPIITESDYRRLLSDFPDLPGYALDGRIKVPAAWLIERAGFKGCLQNGVGMSERQALVLINPGRRGSEQILAFARKVQDEVERMFGVRLVPEPTIIV